MGFLQNAKNSIISDYFKAVEDIAFIRSGFMTEVALFDDHLTLHTPLKKEVVRLQYNQITDVFHGYKTELTEKSKSVIGRAIVGGVLLGPIGAIVGGTSGIGKKTKKDTRIYFIIGYTDSKNNPKIMQFEDTRHFKGKKVAMKLRELTGINGVVTGDNQDVDL